MFNLKTYDEASELGKSYFLKEQLSLVLPEDNVHKKSFNADNVIHCFGSIPFYKRAEIPDNELDDEVKKEMDNVAAQHYDEYTKLLSSTKIEPGFMCTKRSGTPSNMGLIEAINGFYGKEFDQNCYRGITDNVEKPLDVEELFSDEVKSLQDKESSDEDVEKNLKEFDDFCKKLTTSRAYRLCLLSSDESSLSEESDNEYTDEVSDYFAKKKESLNKLLSVSASIVTDKGPQRPAKDHAFKEVTYDSIKPSIVQSFEIRESKILGRQRARAQRAHIRNLRIERRKARVEDIVSQSTDGVEVPLDEIDKRMQSIGFPRPRKVETYDKRKKFIAEQRLKKEPNIIDDPIFYSPQELSDYKNAPIPVKKTKNKPKTPNQQSLRDAKGKQEEHSPKSQQVTQSKQVKKAGKNKQMEQVKQGNDSVDSKTPKQKDQGAKPNQKDQAAKHKQTDQTVKPISKQSEQLNKPKQVNHAANINQKKSWQRVSSSSDDDDDLEELEEFAANLLKRKQGGIGLASLKNTKKI